MNTVLVTGGCGFIGSHFIRLVLSSGRWRVVNLDKLTYAGSIENMSGLRENGSYRFVEGDIADRHLVDTVLRAEKPHSVVNFAAESHVDRSILDSTPFLQTNVFGVQVLLDAVREYPVERFIQISTDEVYGDAAGKQAAAETAPLIPSSPYAASKAAGDLLCLSAARTYDLPVVIVRSSNNYGPFQYPEKLIPLVISKALARESIPVYGDGHQQREWLYVTDNAEAILKVLETERVEPIYNVSTGDGTTNLDLIHEICGLVAEETQTDVRSIIDLITYVQDRPGHDRCYAIRSAPIKQLGWSPTTSLEHGLRLTLRWYLDHQEWVADRQDTRGYAAYHEAVYARGWQRDR